MTSFDFLGKVKQQIDHITSKASEGIVGNASVVRDWFVDTVVNTINNTMRPEDRDEITVWFQKIRVILEDETLDKVDKMKSIYASVEASRTVGILFSSLGESLKNYKDSDLPNGLKIALPVTLAGLAFLGGQAMGLAAFGGAIGAPVALVLFIGSAGVVAIVEGLVKSNSKGDIAKLLKFIAKNEVIRRKEKKFQEALKENATIPARKELSEDEEKLKEALQTMDPFDFERHVMSFFPGTCAVTPAGNDYGIDGWCEHQGRVIVIQCKRYSDENKLGRPEIQKFKGALGDRKADLGIMVCTSTFTKGAVECAELDKHIRLVSLDDLIGWHGEGFDEEILR